MSISSISNNWAAMLNQYLSLNPIAANSSSNTSASTSQAIAAVSQNAAGDTLQLTEALPPLQYTYNSKGGSNDEGSATAKSAAEMFSSLDADGDGVVTEAEFAAARPADVTAAMASTLYQSFDADSSGSLTAAEYEAAAKNAPIAASTGVTSTVDNSALLQLAVSAMLNSLDTDGDGVVSAAEFAAARPKDVTAAMASNLYSALDTDGSGSLTAADYETALKAAAATSSTDNTGDANHNAFQQLAMLMPQPLTAYTIASTSTSSEA